MLGMKALELELTRLAIWWVAVSLVGYILGMWVLYIVIKSAIRDGIQESGLVRTWSRTVAEQQDTHPTPLPLPPMRAER